MKLIVRHDFIYHDIAIKKGCYELEKEKCYLVLGGIIMLPESLLQGNKYYFEVMNTQKDEKLSQTFDLFGGVK
mgnify:CR=1 FL=1